MRIELTTDDTARAAACIPEPKPRRPGLTMGKLAYWGWQYPKVVRREGVLAHMQYWVGQRSLQALLRKPQAVAHRSIPCSGKPLLVSSLTSCRHACMTGLALRSLQNASGREIHPIIHDDGSMRSEHRNFLLHLFPETKFISNDEAEQALESLLPAQKYPVLRKLRHSFFMMRKFIDAHVVDLRRKVVVDADVIFYRYPEELLSRIEESRWFHMVDCQTSYGCPLDTLEQIAGVPVHPRLNAGLVHIDSSSIDWEFLELSAKVILSRHGWSYYLEQALLAVLMAVNRAVPLDAAQYLVNPSETQAREKREVAHHFVDRSIVHFYRFAWQDLLN